MAKKYIAPSELPINEDGSVFHLHVRPEQLAQKIILVGDPGRVPMVASHFDIIECDVQSREFRTITGSYQDKRISCVSTGIGCDNIDIVITELDALVNVDFTTREVKDEIKKYNKMLEEERKTKLPSVYEPLWLNCELLFALAEELQITEAEQNKIEKILHGSSRNERVFLNETLDAKYYFKEAESSSLDDIKLEKGEITVPVSLVSDLSTITVQIGEGGSAVIADDWTIKKVERKTAGDITTFTAQYTSKKAKDASYKDGTKVIVEIKPIDNEECQPVKADFITKMSKKLVLTDLKFERTDK